MLKQAMLYTALGFLVLAEPAIAQESATTLANTVCSSCHGPQGVSISPIFPRLAGQNASYLEAQLKAFHNQSRTDPDAQAYMWGMAAQLDNSTIDSLAKYYASLPPAPGTPMPMEEVSGGEQIFHDGVAAANVPACAVCHGVHAQGVGSFPRLAGQQSEYIIRQLMAFKSGDRSNPVMQEVAQGLNTHEMRELAAYLHSLS